jgi:hypothetical protein
MYSKIFNVLFRGLVRDFVLGILWDVPENKDKNRGGNIKEPSRNRV